VGASGGRLPLQSVETIAELVLLSTEDLKSRLRRVGEERYHHQHPFHRMMHQGELSRGHHSFPQRGSGFSPGLVQESRGSRRRFCAGGRHRGLIRLAEAAGLDRQRVMHCDGVLPAIRYAVDAHLDLVRNRGFLEAVVCSLSPDHHLIESARSAAAADVVEIAWSYRTSMG